MRIVEISTHFDYNYIVLKAMYDELKHFDLRLVLSMQHTNFVK